MAEIDDAKFRSEGVPLEEHEQVLAWFAPDLDTDLAYATGLVVLTDRRVVATLRTERSISKPDQDDAASGWDQWPLSALSGVMSIDRGGVGRVDLMGGGGLLARWRYTIRQAPEARTWVQALQAVLKDEPLPAPAQRAVCGKCGAILPNPGAACSVCDPKGTIPQSARSLLRLGRFARKRVGAIALGFVLTMAGTAAGLVPAYLTMPLIDRVLIPMQKEKTVPFHVVYWYLFGLAAAALIAWALGWARSFVMAWISERISVDIRNTTFAHLQQLSLEYFGGKRTGDLIARLSSDTDRICNYLSVNIVDFGSDIFMIGGTAAVLFVTDPILALATLSPFPLVIWLVSRVRGRVRRLYQGSGRIWSEMTSVLTDAITGVRVVKAFAQEQREIERFRHGNDLVLAANDRVNAIWAYVGPLLTLLTQMGLLVIWGVGAWRVFTGQITVGVLTLFISYLGRFYVRLESMSRIVQATQRAGASSDRLFEILDREPTVADPPRPRPIVDLQGAITLDRVSFRYGNRLVLEDIQLDIAPGEMIGLVGLSGSGKSTLINLICRFYDVVEGSIKLDGVDLRELATRDYRRNIGLVLQEPYLFYGTVAENIAYGRPDAARSEIVAAARAARAHEFILRLPHAYDSVVGERGQALSGGERQRISIARAILINPSILILDEATSSVDTETELLIQEALENLVHGRTTIAIAHRLSTLRMADRLVVLDRGRIVEVGRHEELLEKGGAFARLYRAQAELVEPKDGEPRSPIIQDDVERTYTDHVRELAES